MLLLFLAQATYFGSGTPPPPRPQGIFSYEDYPAEALLNRWEGSVIADLTVNERGAVAACHIIKSSGHEVLDEATCKLLIERARFKPATDKDGKPIKDMYRTPSIEWRIH